MNINNNSNKLKRDFSQVEGENESPPAKYPKLSSVTEQLAFSSKNSPTSLKNQVSKTVAQPEIEKVAFDQLEIGSGLLKEIKDPVDEAHLPYWSLIPMELKTILLSNLDFMDLLKIRPVSQELKATVDGEILKYVNCEKISLDTSSGMFAYMKRTLEHHGIHLKYLHLDHETSFSLKDFGKLVTYCPNLEEIHMNFASPDAQRKVVAAIFALAKNNKLSHLKTLSVSAKNQVMIQYLMDAPLGQLTSLKIVADNLDNLLEKMCKSPHLSNLNHLTLTCGSHDQRELKPESLEKLHHAPFKLSSLNLAGIKIGEQGMKILNDLVNISEWNLSELNLASCDLGDSAMSDLAGLLKSSKVTTLDLGMNKITEEGIKKIAPYISSLSVLYLGANKIGSKGLELILNAKPKLTELEMYGTEIGDQGAQMLFASENFKFIRILNLQSNNLSSELFSILEEKQIDSNLEFLYIGDNKNIQNSDAEKIAQSNLFSKLKYLDISWTQISPEGGITILKALNQLKGMRINDEPYGTDESVNEMVETELEELARIRGCKIDYE